ncbi:MAG: hypothetical protein V4556_09425 [Bacteroidota bacterium]
MKKIFYFILSHSIFIAICSAALVLQTFQLLHLTVNYYTIAFIFFATLSSYNFYWLVSKNAFGKIKYDRSFFKNEFSNAFLFIAASVAMMICFLKSSLIFYTILPGFVLTILYALPLLPVKSLTFTKRLGILKTVLLALTWVYVTVCVPVNKLIFDLSDSELFVFARRFLFMLMLCIIFDSRDSAMDKIRGLHSLATDLSQRALRTLVIIVFIALFSTFLFHERFNISLYQSIALQISTVALLVVFYFSTKKQDYGFYYFIVDGMMLFSAMATYIASI